MSDRPPVKAILETYGLDARIKVEGMSVEEVGKVLAPFSGSEELFTPLLKVSDALWTNLGVKGKKRFSQDFAATYPKVTAGFIQAILNNNCEITALWDTTTGSFIEAKQPVDMMSLRGILGADVIELSPGLIRIEVATETKGQLFDWGKSKRLVNQIFERTNFYLTKLA